MFTGVALINVVEIIKIVDKAATLSEVVSRQEVKTIVTIITTHSNRDETLIGIVVAVVVVIMVVVLVAATTMVIFFF